MQRVNADTTHTTGTTGINTWLSTIVTMLSLISVSYLIVCIVIRIQSIGAITEISSISRRIKVKGTTIDGNVRRTIEHRFADTDNLVVSHVTTKRTTIDFRYHHTTVSGLYRLILRSIVRLRWVDKDIYPAEESIERQIYIINTTIIFTFCIEATCCTITIIISSTLVTQRTRCDTADDTAAHLQMHVTILRTLMVTRHDGTNVVRRILGATEIIVIVIPFTVYINNDMTLDRLIRTSCQTVLVPTATCSLTS